MPVVQQLAHSTAEIMQRALIDLGLGTDPTDSPQGAWPVHDGTEPDKPDDCMTVRATTGREDGRAMPTGERLEHYGFQVRLRATDKPTGIAKAWAVAVALDQTLYDLRVSLDLSAGGSQSYLVQCVTRSGTVNELGPEKANTRRELFTINGLATISQP